MGYISILFRSVIFFSIILRFLLILSCSAPLFRKTVFFPTLDFIFGFPCHFPSILKPVTLILGIISKLSSTSLTQLCKGLFVFIKLKQICRKPPIIISIQLSGSSQMEQTCVNLTSVHKQTITPTPKHPSLRTLVPTVVLSLRVRAQTPVARTGSAPCTGFPDAQTNGCKLHGSYSTAHDPAAQ